ncbi:MAG: response regulator transcription factor [Sphingobium sp.]
MSLQSSASRLTQLAGFAVRMRDSDTIRPAVEILQEAGHLIGLPTPTFVDDVYSDRPVEVGQNCNLQQGLLGWHPTMLRWWYEERVGLRHPDVQRATTALLPYTSQVYDGRPDDLSHDQRHIRSYMNRWGLSSQLLVPVHLPRGTSSLVGWASPRPGAVLDISDDSWAALMPLAYAFVDVVERCRNGARAGGALFSARQRECLSLMAQGRNVKEIAIDLGLSPHTVRDYLKGAARRVNARSRSQLLSIAWSRGEIDAPAAFH